jgi:hypothetical protein
MTALLDWKTKDYNYNVSAFIVATQVAEIAFPEPELIREVIIDDAEVTDEIRQIAIKNELAYRDFKGLPVTKCAHGTYDFEPICPGCYDDGERQFYYGY